MDSVGFILQTKNIIKEFIKVKTLPELLTNKTSSRVCIALDNVTIGIKRSEFICLLGLNGAGKTTLLKILSGILLPTSGEIYFKSNKVKNLQQLRKEVSYIMGDARSFYWRLTAKENLEFFAYLCGIKPFVFKSKLDNLLELFKIPNPNKKFYEYSEGIKQRFCIIRALLKDPTVLLLDEFNKGLDCIMKEEVLKFLKEKLVKEEAKSVVISTNNFDNVEDFDRIIVLHQGKVRFQGSAQELKDFFKLSTISCRDIFKKLCG